MSDKRTSYVFENLDIFHRILSVSLFFNQTDMSFVCQMHSIFFSFRFDKQHVTRVTGMLPKNCQVGRQILNNIAKNSFSAFRFGKKVQKDGKLIEWSRNKIRLTPEQYQMKLKQCPKPSFAQLCCKKLFSKPKPKKVNLEFI